MLQRDYDVQEGMHYAFLCLGMHSWRREYTHPKSGSELEVSLGGFEIVFSVSECSWTLIYHASFRLFFCVRGFLFG